MAEIKSTLDLVMERTKHLTLSAEEKSGQRKKDFDKKLNGLLQQYEDTILSDSELLEKTAALQADLSMDDDRLVVSAVAQRINPELDNAHWLALIKNLAPAACTPLEQALVDYRDKVATVVQKSEQVHLEMLARDQGIRGSAVGLNPQKYATLQEELASLKKDTTARIEEVLQNLG